MSARLSAHAEERPMEPAVIAGTYRLLHHLGSGGTSEVHEAEHLRLGLRVAVKIFRPEGTLSPRAVALFEREARTLAGIASEFVVRIMDCGRLEDGKPYLVMERVAGEDLRSLLRREGTLSARRTLRIAITACRGLIAVHEAHVIHRDLKPANLFITRRSTGEESCKILDFGVAKSVTTETSHRGSLVGTVRYMAPEQLADSARVGPASDIYALGAILYECLSGLPMHDAATVQELMFQVLNCDAVALRDHEPKIPLELANVVMRAVARDPERRFGSVQELLTSLERLLDDGAQHRSPPEHTMPDGTSGSTVRRSGWQLWSAVLGLSTLCGVASWWWPPRALAHADVQQGAELPASAASGCRPEGANSLPVSVAPTPPAIHAGSLTAVPAASSSAVGPRGPSNRGAKSQPVQAARRAVTPPVFTPPFLDELGRPELESASPYSPRP